MHMFGRRRTRMGSQVYSTVHEYAGCSFTVQSSNDFRKDSRPLLVAHSWIHDGPRQEPGHVHGPTLRNGCAHRACTLDTGQTDTRRKHHGGWILPGGGGGGRPSSWLLHMDSGGKT